MAEIFNNGLLKVEPETVEKDSEKINKLLVTIPRNGFEDLKINFINDGYGISQTGEDLDEFNLTNKILYELFEEKPKNQNLDMPEKAAKYLIETAKQPDTYVFEEGKLYCLPNLRIPYVNRIMKYNEKIQNKNAIEANQTLVQIILDTEESQLACLVNSNLHFAGKKDGEKYNPRDDIFGEIVPVYTCKRSKVSGIIKHVYNKMVKESKINPTQMNTDKFISKLKKTLDGIHIFISNVEIIGEYDAIAYIDCKNNMTIELVDGDSIKLQFTGEDGVTYTLSNIATNKFDKLRDLVSCHIIY